MAKLYVAYGSNLNKEQMKDRCPGAEFVGTGSIENYELQFKGSLPHVHLIACSTVPGEGHLSAKGVEKMRSAFAREIFSQELMFTYQQQTEYRDRLREQGRESISEIAAKINAGEYLNPRIEELLVQLSDRLSHTTGKKVYGYLKSDVKAIVDQIVAELAGNENIRELYDLWYEQREKAICDTG